MKLKIFFWSLGTGASLALFASLSAAAASIDDTGLTATRGEHGSGIARMVAEATQIRPLSATEIGDAVVPAFVDRALDHVLTTGRADVFPSTVESAWSDATLLAALPVSHPSAEHLSALGTSSIRVAGTKTLQPWNLVPDQSERFLQVALGMMGLGFVPSALRRSR